MPLQKSHGRLFPLVSPPDELPEGVAAPEPEPSGPLARRSGGQVTAGVAARELGRRGGRESARRRADAKAWGASLGLGRLLTLTEDAHLAPFVREAEAWLEAQAEACARDVGGGMLSAGVTSVLRTAAWERLYSAWLFDCGTRAVFAWDVLERDQEGKAKVTLPRTELLAVAARLGDASRQNVLCGFELAAREAESRSKGAPGAGLARLQARVLGTGRR
jgi:hypothetical protein